MDALTIIPVWLERKLGRGVCSFLLWFFVVVIVLYFFYACYQGLGPLKTVESSVENPFPGRRIEAMRGVRLTSYSVARSKDKFSQFAEGAIYVTKGGERQLLFFVSRSTNLAYYYDLEVDGGFVPIQIADIDVDEDGSIIRVYFERDPGSVAFSLVTAIVGFIGIIAAVLEFYKVR